MTNPMNLGQHKHREITIDGRQICQDCQQVLWNPVTSQEDFEARLADVPAWTSPEETITSVAIFDAAQDGNLMLGTDELHGCPLDYQLIRMVEELGVPQPDYVMKVGAAHEDMPPHTRQGQTAVWWNG